MPTDNERKAFEAWSINAWGDVGHFDPYEWAAWQARAAVAPQPGSDVSHLALRELVAQIETAWGEDDEMQNVAETLRWSRPDADGFNRALDAARAALTRGGTTGSSQPPPDSAGSHETNEFLSRLHHERELAKLDRKLDAVAPQPAPPMGSQIHFATSMLEQERAIGFREGYELALKRAAPASGDTPAIPKGDALTKLAEDAMRHGSIRRHIAPAVAAGDAVPVALTDEQCDAIINEVLRTGDVLVQEGGAHYDRALIRAGYTAAPAEKKG